MEKRRSSLAHTPGPWHYKKDGFRISIGNQSTRHDYLAHNYTVSTIDGNSLQSEANARLIAAAPDLLEAAKEALHLAERGVAERLRYAIAKATGSAGTK